MLKSPLGPSSTTRKRFKKSRPSSISAQSSPTTSSRTTSCSPATIRTQNVGRFSLLPCRNPPTSASPLGFSASSSTISCGSAVMSAPVSNSAGWSLTVRAGVAKFTTLTTSTGAGGLYALLLYFKRSCIFSEMQSVSEQFESQRGLRREARHRIERSIEAEV